MQLKELPNTAVYLKTQEEYDELMKIYEEAGWKWCDGDKPTSKNYFEEYSKFCVRAQDAFEYSSKSYYESICCKFISLDEFKQIQGLFPIENQYRDLFNEICLGEDRVFGKLHSVNQELYKNVQAMLNDLYKYPKKGLMSYLQDIPKNIKKLLDKSTRALYQLGWVDSKLELTAKGEEELTELLFEKFKVELGEKAIKEVAKIKKEEKE